MNNTNAVADEYETKLNLLLDWMDIDKIPTKKETTRRYKKLAEFSGYDAKGLAEDGGWCYDVLKDLVEDHSSEEIQKLIQD